MAHDQTALALPSAESGQIKVVATVENKPLIQTARENPDKYPDS
jgi:hypothetical protein